ncbi:MAG: YafY family transcriptional regulator [Sphingobacteriales bacterium JAD_PAG50586_3]|nr:MAG: YafY family transcriptional regulator [Sphingobacteriales bacterium JAD_PAG50586_3]
MNRIDRLFGILILLQSRKYVTAEKIAEKFEISVRTVYRDIRALSDLGVPVSFEPPFGYFIVNGHFMPPVSFTTEEANALLLMEPMVGYFADKSIDTHYRNALNKVKNVLKNSQKEKAEELSANIKIQTPQRFVSDMAHLADIQNAIAGKTILNIDYKDFKNEISKRQVEPIGLIFYAFAWHLIGWCHLRRAYRDFKVIRIAKLQSTTEAFTFTQHMPLTDYMKELPVDW